MISSHNFNNSSSAGNSSLINVTPGFKTLLYIGKIGVYKSTLLNDKEATFFNV